ncbi:transposase, partial [Escherichia coli]
MCTENPQLGWGFRKAFSFEPVIKTPFDLLKHLAVWQLQESNKKSKGVPMGNEKSLAHTRWNCKYHIVFAPKYRRQVFYREKRRATGSILRKLCEWK